MKRREWVAAPLRHPAVRGWLRWLVETLLQAAVCFVCGDIMVRDPYLLGQSEFLGGTVTGPLLSWSDTGGLLFFAAFLLTFLLRRIAALVVMVASLLTVPLSLYFVTPVLYRWIFPRGWDFPLRSPVVWDTWAMSRLLAAAVAICVAVRTLRISGIRTPSRPASC